ncbi:hypothetical protein F511_30878 [Dorcoceras hygrometricum]|uniref:RING-type domain-containing protein n=1 Tax=Dorcoceras hygrometricum TaxID=472368 RepID=A0A2Z7A4X4_9LAMI|nr:hypothetical protein F511_30878 [Dorcoceras hygrometricum]
MAACDQIVLCKAALIFAVTRWILSLALNLFTRFSMQNAGASSCTRRPPSSANLRILRSSLSLTSLGNMEHRLPENGEYSCAICLNRLKNSSQVWELRNCCHVFHNNCLEKWLRYDSRFSCPLCRVALLSPAPPDLQPPSWAVEKMLYLFGDDLLP